MRAVAAESLNNRAGPPWGRRNDVRRNEPHGSASTTQNEPPRGSAPSRPRPSSCRQDAQPWATNRRRSSVSDAKDLVRRQSSTLLDVAALREAKNGAPDAAPCEGVDNGFRVRHFWSMYAPAPSTDSLSTRSGPGGPAAPPAHATHAPRARTSRAKGRPRQSLPGVTQRDTQSNQTYLGAGTDLRRRRSGPFDRSNVRRSGKKPSKSAYADGFISEDRTTTRAEWHGHRMTQQGR